MGNSWDLRCNLPKGQAFVNGLGRLGRDQIESPWCKLRKPQGPTKEAQNENVHFGRIIVTRKLGKCHDARSPRAKNSQGRGAASGEPALGTNSPDPIKPDLPLRRLRRASVRGCGHDNTLAEPAFSHTAPDASAPGAATGGKAHEEIFLHVFSGRLKEG